jgi:short-subunit dehydrogenase
MRAISTQVIQVTGSTDGLGKKIAVDLTKLQATILLHKRNQEKGERVLREIQHETGNHNTKYYNAALASIDAVRGLAKTILTDYNPLDILINNAGISVR